MSNGHAPVSIDDLATLEEFDLDRLRQQAVEAGVDLSAMGHQGKIAERRQRAALLAHKQRQSRAAQWHETMQRWVATIADFMVLAVTLFAKYLMPPVGIVGLWYVEIQRTETGVRLFDAPRASWMSVVLMSVYLSMLVVRADMAARAGETTSYRWSLRALANGLWYWFGLRRLQQRSQLEVIDGVIRGLVALIVVLGTAGTLAQELAAFDGAWYRALWNIGAKSDLLTMLTLVSGAMVSYLLLVALHYVVQMTYAQFAQIMPEDAMSADFFAAYSDAQRAADEAEALYIMTAIQKRKSKP